MIKFYTFLVTSFAITPLMHAHFQKGEHCGRPKNLDIARRQVAEYYENHCFHDEVTQVVEKAMKHFECKVNPKDRLTVVFDIDETILSEYWFLKDIQFGYVPKLTHEWIMRAETPAIPETKKLYYYLLDRGYHIIFITGRQSNEYDATLKNLTREGIVGFDKLIVRSPEAKKLSAQKYKEIVRSQLTEEGYTIVGCIGDQYSDIEGKFVGYAVKLPNYVYIIQ